MLIDYIRKIFTNLDEYVFGKPKEPPKPTTPAEEILEQIKKILFPPFETKFIEGVKVLTDYSIDSNLDAVLMDLQDGKNDEISHKTIISVIKRLQSVRKMLNIEHEFESDAEYFNVENLDLGPRIEDIK